MHRSKPNRHVRRATRAARRRRLVVAGTTAGLLAASSGHATTVDEAQVGDLPNDFASRTLLPVGTDEVVGDIATLADEDHFAFQGLAPGAAFTLELAVALQSAPYYRWRDASGSVLESQCPYTPGQAFEGTVPATGQIAFSTDHCEGSNTWGVTLDLVAADETYDEGASGDLGDSFEMRTLLGRGALEAQGSIDPDTDADYLTLQGLPADASFDLVLAIPIGSGGVEYQWLDDGGSVLTSQQVYINSGAAGAFAGTVPENGELHLGMLQSEGGVKTWAVTLTLPEPGTPLLAGGALGSLAGLARKRRRRG